MGQFNSVYIQHKAVLSEYCSMSTHCYKLSSRCFSFIHTSFTRTDTSVAPGLYAIIPNKRCLGPRLESNGASISHSLDSSHQQTIVTIPVLLQNHWYWNNTGATHLFSPTYKKQKQFEKPILKKTAFCMVEQFRSITICMRQYLVYQH